MAGRTRSRNARGPARLITWIAAVSSQRTAASYTVDRLLRRSADSHWRWVRHSRSVPIGKHPSPLLRSSPV
jgi:hypothetical protein